MSNNNHNSNIAIVFDDLTEFFVMRPAIDELNKQNLKVDIIVPFDSGYNGLAEHTIQTIKEAGYSPLKDAPKNKTYQILLTPYPNLEVIKRTKFHYHLRYPYGAATSKPNPVFLPNWKIDYDAIISFNTNETSFLEAYGAKCYTVPYWIYSHSHKKNHNTQKPILLFLPTFGSDISCIQHLTMSAINNIKKHYTIIAKAHHATQYHIDNQSDYKKMQSFADIFYDSNTPIATLFEKADLTLSDNSGAIFESIITNTPVALFAKDLNKRHLNGINTLQQDIVNQGIIPHTDQPKKILPMLQSINTYIPKQKQLKKELFLSANGNPYEPFIDIIKKYLSMNLSQDYRKVLHDLLLEEWYGDKATILELKKQLSIERQQHQLDNEKYQKHIRDIYDSTSWKITKPLRKLKTIKGESNEN